MKYFGKIIFTLVLPNSYSKSIDHLSLKKFSFSKSTKQAQISSELILFSSRSSCSLDKMTCIAIGRYLAFLLSRPMRTLFCVLIKSSSDKRGNFGKSKHLRLLFKTSNRMKISTFFEISK